MSRIAAYGKPICANCKHFHFRRDYVGNLGDCPYLGIMDGNDKTCTEFVFGPELPTLRTCPICGEEFDSMDGEKFCEVCIVSAGIDIIHYGG